MANNSLNITTQIVQNDFSIYTKKAQKKYVQALNDVLDDLVRTGSQSAPHDKGVLEKSWSKEIQYKGINPVGVVTFSVKKASGKGNFNYALKMHEDLTYNLGAGSRAKSGGTGMSGKTYPVGTGYLGDVLKGEEEAYKKHIEKALKEL